MYILKYEADYTVFDTVIIKKREFTSFNDLLKFAKHDSEVLDGKAVIINTEATTEYAKEQKLKRFINSAK